MKIKRPLPKIIRPMLATLVDEPPKDEGWLYEIKWDGYRALAFCNQDKVNLLSRNSKSFTGTYYPLVEALKNLKLKAVLDGEIVVLKENKVSSFGALQNWRSEADGQLAYFVFDLLWLDGYDLMALSLIERKQLLRKLIPKEGIIQESQVYTGSPFKFLEAAKKMGLEGIMAKRSESIYRAGDRARDWLKIKVQKRHEVVIGGFTKNDNSPQLFSALLVGIYKKNKLHYIGKIGTGFNGKMQKEMMTQFKPLITQKPPFAIEPDVNLPSRFRPNPPHAKATWLKPKLVCEVSYTELTSDEIMRHPSFEGMRKDKNTEDVHLEIARQIPIKQGDRKTLLNPSENSQTKVVKGHELKFSNLKKVFWPQEGYTKGDLLNYYYQVAPYILPYLKNRPQSLNRFPNGIKGFSFYQKDVTISGPDWIKKYPYVTSKEEHKNFLIVQNEADLLWMANLGAIEMNPWNSTIIKPDCPDWCIIDIDPSNKNSFEQVIEVAQVTHQILKDLKIEGYCKTSGATGLHIYIPMGARYSYEQCQLLGRLIATQVNLTMPELTSIERMTVNRKGKVYVDFLQNRAKATLASAYSIRPMPGAPVSMPLHWDEVKKGLQQKQFNIKNALQRLKSEGDLFKPVLGKGINLNKVLNILTD